jgi:hypothetical protein
VLGEVIGDMMPVFVHDNDVVEKIVGVESPDDFPQYEINRYRDELLDESISTSVVSARIQFANNPQSRPVIYGNGGWNRYVIIETGEIIFLATLAVKFFVQRAQGAGFSVY